MAEGDKDPNLEMDPGDFGPTVSRDPMLGAHLGEYVVQERIGAGGMGIVYGGVHPVIGKKVAIKVLQWEAAKNPEEAARLKAEARLVNSIGHRGIVDIYDFGKTRDGREYVVMELLSGEPLDKVIATRAPLPVPEVLSMLEEICDALAAAHGAGVIHRDLKPNNVFYVAPPHGARYLKLLDFGLAKSTTPHGSSAQTRDSMVVGTPYYMAPEQARAQAVSPQTDLYSLGVMAFELLTGKLPFDAPTPFEVISLHLNAPPPAISALERSVPPALEELVLKMMAKVPGDRPQSAAYVRRELQRIKNRLQTDATNVGAAPKRPLAVGAELDEAPEQPSEGATQLEMPALNLVPKPEPAPIRTQEYGLAPKRPEPARMISPPPAPFSPVAPLAAPGAPPGPPPETRRRTSQPPRAPSSPGSTPHPKAAPPVAGDMAAVEPSTAITKGKRTSTAPFVVAAVAVALAIGALWGIAGPMNRPKMPELPKPPVTAPDQPPTLTPPPEPKPPPVDVKPEPEPKPPPVDVKPEPEPKPPPVDVKPKPDPEPKPPVGDGRPDPRKPRPPLVGKKPPVDVTAYRLTLLGRVDALIGLLEAQNEKLELTMAGSLRKTTSTCATLQECRVCERQLTAMEARHK